MTSQKIIHGDVLLAVRRTLISLRPSIWIAGIAGKQGNGILEVLGLLLQNGFGHGNRDGDPPVSYWRSASVMA
jgi:hypothetical protein